MRGATPLALAAVLAACNGSPVPASGPDTEIPIEIRGIPREAEPDGPDPAIPTLRDEPPERVDPAVAALDWLVRHQSPDGSWSAAGFHERCTGEPCDGAATAMGDAGATGVALLPFLGCGETHKTPRYGRVVGAGLKRLMSMQDSDGAFGPRGGPIRDHALATLAMAEAFGMTQSPPFRVPVQRAVDFLARCRRSGGVWGRTEGAEEDDLAVTAWCAMACKSAVNSEFAVDPAVLPEVAAWIDRECDPETLRPRAGDSASPDALTAMAMLSRIFCGAGKDDPAVLRGRDSCARTVPSWSTSPERNDLVYWYFGTLAMFQVGDPPWRRRPGDEFWGRWAPALAATIRPNLGSADAGCARGSMAAGDRWTKEGGRVFSTALSAMMEEVFYR